MKQFNLEEAKTGDSKRKEEEPLDLMVIDETQNHENKEQKNMITMDEERDFEAEIHNLTKQVKYYQQRIREYEEKEKTLNETKDAFIAFCHNILNGKFISDKVAAEEQLNILENNKN